MLSNVVLVGQVVAVVPACILFLLNDDNSLGAESEALLSANPAAGGANLKLHHVRLSLRTWSAQAGIAAQTVRDTTPASAAGLVQRSQLGITWHGSKTGERARSKS